MLEAIRPRGSTTDHLFVATDRHQYFTCSWDAASDSLRTEQSYVDASDKTLRDTRENDRVHVDPTQRFMTVEMHDGVITVIPITQPSQKKIRRDSSAKQDKPGTLQDPINVRVEEIAIRASCFLDADEDSTESARLGLLWEDNQAEPQLKVLELNIMTKENQQIAELETVAELKDADQLDRGVTHLIPVPRPYGGFLVLGERSIAYANSELTEFHPQSLDERGQVTIWSCWTAVDNLRWLLADDYGNLYFLMLEFHNASTIGKWQLDKLDRASTTSKASCLIYLDQGYVFVGSHSGDSQLVQIVDHGVEIVQTFNNIAPILDLQLMDLGRGAETAASSGEFSTGQARLISCSGSWQDGSIRSVRSGVGMEDVATFADVPLITDMWGVSSLGGDSHRDVLIASTPTETRIFRFIPEGEVEELSAYANLDLSESTYLACNLPSKRLLQVRESGFTISDLDSGMSLSSWKPSDSTAKITNAAANDAHVILVEDGRTIHVFHTSNSPDSPSISKTFEEESQISSIALSRTQANACVISFWQSASIALVDIHSLEIITTQVLGTPGNDVPRSLIVAQMIEDAIPTLFVSMADGTVVTFSYDTKASTLSNMTKILLGSQPVFLKVLPRTDKSGKQFDNVFASCEQPSLIYGAENRIMFSAINSDTAARVCPLDPEAFPGAIAVASDSDLRLALIDTKRTTQIQTLPIGDTVRCLAYQRELKMFAMATIQRVLEQTEDEPREDLRSFVKLVDEVTFKEIDSFELDEHELVECITAYDSPQIEEDDNSYKFVVGTSVQLVSDTDAADERGRILVFSVNPAREKLELVAELRTKGACRSIASSDSLIIAGLVKVVAVYSLPRAQDRSSKYPYKFTRQATYRTSTAPITLDITPATEIRLMKIAVGDIMKSMTVLEYDPSLKEKSLSEIARHFATFWTSALVTLNQKEWVAADMEGNLIMLRHNPEAYGDEGRRLELTGEVRIGEVVNKIIAINPDIKDEDEAGAAIGRGKARSGSSTSHVRSSSMSQQRAGPLVRPQAFIATVEGSIYMLGGINPQYMDSLLRLQACLTPKVSALGGMPWSRYRAFKTEVREADEPFRFVDGEVLEQALLNESDEILHGALTDSGLGEQGLTVDSLRVWGEDLRRLY